MKGLSLLVAVALFMEFLDGSALNPAIPKIAASFGVAAVDLGPVASAYAISLAIFILPSGWLADRFGPRPVFATAIAVFTAGSLFSAMAGSAMELLFGRVLQGIGGAMMFPVGRLIVLKVTPRSQLLNVMTRLVWPAQLAPILGPVVGGYLTDAFSWRAIFLINLPIGIAAIAAALHLIPKFETPPQRPFDTKGFVLAALALTMLLACVDRLVDATGGVTFVALAFVAFCATALFARHLRHHPRPILTFEAMRHDCFRRSLLGGTGARIVLNAVLFLLPLMLQLCRSYTALDAGLVLMPFFVGVVAMQPFTTRILRAVGFRAILVTNSLLQGGFVALCAVMVDAVSLSPLPVLLFLAGASRSLQITAVSTLTFADVPEEHIGSANLLNAVSFHVSAAFGIGIGAALVQVGGAVMPDLLAAFRVVFLVSAAAATLLAFDFARLPANAGETVAGRR